MDQYKDLNQHYSARNRQDKTSRTGPNPKLYKVKLIWLLEVVNGIQCVMTELQSWGFKGMLSMTG